MFKFLLTLLIFLFFAPVLEAQRSGADVIEDSITIDSSFGNAQPEGAGEDGSTQAYQKILSLSPVSLSADSVKAWKNEKAFIYLKNLDSLLHAKQRQDMEVAKAPDKKQSSSFIYQLLNSGFLQVLFWGIVLAVVIFIVYRLFISNGFFKRNSTQDKENSTTNEAEPGRPEDYDLLIRQALKQDDFRLATRYLFLKTLLLLADRELLQLSVDKTNFQYVQEMLADKRNPFAALVLNYEYVWYGNLQLTESQYRHIETKFSSFNSGL